jgi:hypothetical protein
MDIVLMITEKESEGLWIAYQGWEWVTEARTSVADPAELARASNSSPEPVDTVAENPVLLISSPEPATTRQSESWQCWNEFLRFLGQFRPIIHIPNHSPAMNRVFKCTCSNRVVVKRFGFHWEWIWIKENEYNPRTYLNHKILSSWCIASS